MTLPTAPAPPPPPPDPAERRRACRPVIALATLFTIAGILTAALFPGRGSLDRPESAPTSPTLVAKAAELPEAAGSPDAPAAEPAAQAPEEAAQKQEQAPPPLPPVPEGEPSRFIVNGDRGCKAIALTYDAGSGADGAAAILDVLKQHRLKATFFLTGRWVEKFPDLARRIADEGHEIGNHSYSHPDFTRIADGDALKQLADATAAIRKATGRAPSPLFREPYGAFNEHERRLVRQGGYLYSIYWDVDTLDWQFPGVELLLSRIMKARGGSIVLMHMNVADTARASDQAIPLLQAQGYRLLTVSQLLTCAGR